MTEPTSPAAASAAQPVGYVLPTPTELRIFLEMEAIDEVRAALLLEQAEDLALTVVAPLPKAARSVILSAAGRVYVNPQGSAYQAAGPFSMNSTTGGIYLTKEERRALQRAAGRGSAFTVDPTPRGAGYGFGRRPVLNGPDNLPPAQYVLEDYFEGQGP